MPSADTATTAPSGPLLARFVVRPTLVMELVWALFVADDDAAEADFPARVSRFAAAPELPARIRDFWADGEPCFTEVFVAAERGGVLFEDDPDRLWAGLAAGTAAPARFEALASETPADQARFRERLARLHDDPSIREGWLALLRDTWAVIDAQWRAEGQEVAEALAWELRSRLPDAGSYADLVPLVEGCDFGGLLPRLVSEAAAGDQEIVLSPAWLGRKGFLISLTGLLLWAPSLPSRSIGPSAEVRDRARRYKALGDPNRLAIFEAAARRPRTVGELARALGVTQPTVSNHVRILRDAGLLHQENAGGRRLSADVSGFERLLDEARRAVTGVRVA